MLNQRMYVIVMRHLSGIQKGIQAAHAVVEYANLHHETEEYQKWALEDKTLIVLECGTSDNLLDSIGKLSIMGIKPVGFVEPDLSNIRTAIAFLADERVYDSDKYSSESLLEHDLRRAFIRDFVRSFPLASN